MDRPKQELKQGLQGGLLKDPPKWQKDAFTFECERLDKLIANINTHISSRKELRAKVIFEVTHKPAKDGEVFDLRKGKGLKPTLSNVKGLVAFWQEHHSMDVIRIPIHMTTLSRRVDTCHMTIWKEPAPPGIKDGMKIRDCQRIMGLPVDPEAVIPATTASTATSIATTVATATEEEPNPKRRKASSAFGFNLPENA